MARNSRSENRMLIIFEKNRLSNYNGASARNARTFPLGDDHI